jgi:hypothetical protein
MNQKDSERRRSGLAHSSLPPRLPKTRWFHSCPSQFLVAVYLQPTTVVWGCSVKATAFWLCLVGVCIPLLASGQGSHFAASDKSVALVDAVLLPGEPLIWPIRAALIQNYTTCTNCLIRRCLVVGGKLNGYCLTGARGGICHESYDPTHCPAGKLPKAPVKRQCGPSVSVFTVDNLRACQ